MRLILTFLIVAAAIIDLVIGIGFFLNPVSAGSDFGLVPAGEQGRAVLRADMTAFFMMDTDRAGLLVEYDTTAHIFTNPKDKRTEDYITGRFG